MRARAGWMCATPLVSCISFVSRDARDPQVAALRDSTTVYVGNLSFYTTEAQIYELYSTLLTSE